MRPNSFGYVAESVDGGAPDGFLVRLQQFQKLEADPHPLTSGHVFGAAVSNATNQINAVLLHLEAMGSRRLDTIGW